MLLKSLKASGVAAFHRFAGAMVDRLGRCPRCMRTAFISAACAALAAALATAVLPPLWAVLAWTAALALAALWLAHAWMFALRGIRSAATPADAGPAATRQAEPWSRRRLLAVFAHTLFFSAAMSLLPRSALAFACNCGEGCYCDDPAFPKCVFSPTRGESICCGANAVPCAAPYLTYCCPSGTRCYGDGSKSPYCY